MNISEMTVASLCKILRLGVKVMDIYSSYIMCIFAILGAGVVVIIFLLVSGKDSLSGVFHYGSLVCASWVIFIFCDSPQQYSDQVDAVAQQLNTSAYIADNPDVQSKLLILARDVDSLKNLHVKKFFTIGRHTCVSITEAVVTYVVIFYELDKISITRS